MCLPQTNNSQRFINKTYNWWNWLFFWCSGDAPLSIRPTKSAPEIFWESTDNQMIQKCTAELLARAFTNKIRKHLSYTDFRAYLKHFCLCSISNDFSATIRNVRCNAKAKWIFNAAARLLHLELFEFYSVVVVYFLFLLHFGCASTANKVPREYLLPLMHCK